VACEENLLDRQHDEQVVITLPGEIDVTNSPGLRETLLAVIRQQSVLLVADMSATTFCDSSGINVIVAAYRQAVAVGADMRLVIRHSAARRVFEINGIDTVIGIYPDLPAALSGGLQALVPRAPMCGKAAVILRLFSSQQAHIRSVLYGAARNCSPGDHRGGLVGLEVPPGEADRRRHQRVRGRVSGSSCSAAGRRSPHARLRWG
jgi:anti-sigma B factor antagonist